MDKVTLKHYKLEQLPTWLQACLMELRALLRDRLPQLGGVQITMDHLSKPDPFDITVVARILNGDIDGEAEAEETRVQKAPRQEGHEEGTGA